MKMHESSYEKITKKNVIAKVIDNKVNLQLNCVEYINEIRPKLNGGRTKIRLSEANKHCVRSKENDDVLHETLRKSLKDASSHSNEDSKKQHRKHYQNTRKVDLVFFYSLL